MRTRNAMIPLIGVLCILAGCSNSISGEDTPSFSAIALANDIDKSLFVAAPFNGEDSWQAINAVVLGAASGSAIVNGSYDSGKVSGYTGVYEYKFTKVIIEFSDFCCVAGDYHLTGTVFLDGKITSYTSSHSYSGTWGITGTLTVTGDFSGTAVLDLAHTTKYYGSGTIEFNGVLYDVEV